MLKAWRIPKANNFVGVRCVWCNCTLMAGEKVTCAPCLGFARRKGVSVGSLRRSNLVPPVFLPMINKLIDG